MESLRTCKLFGVIRAVLGIKGALPLIHGPVGCFYHIKYLLSIRSGRLVTILCTEMDQEDVVFGGEEKLLQNILMADQKYQPRVIAVLSSCASSIIGENIDQVLDKAREKVSCDLITVNSGGFEGSQIEGYQESLNVLIELMETAPQKDSINLIGQYRGGSDLKILQDYFKRLNLHVNCVLTAGCTMEDVKKAPQAKLNISMCQASATEPCETMQTRFGIPFMEESIPLGFYATSTFLKKLCSLMKRGYVFDEDELKSKYLISKFKSFLKNKRVIIVAGATRALPLAEFVCELGMEPVLICLDFEGKYTNVKLNEIKNRRNINPVVLKAPDYFEILDQARNLNSDLILGGMGEIGLACELGKPLIDVMHAQEITFGFDGAVILAEKIVDTLKKAA